MAGRVPVFSMAVSVTASDIYKALAVRRDRCRYRPSVHLELVGVRSGWRRARPLYPARRTEADHAADGHADDQRHHARAAGARRRSRPRSSRAVGPQLHRDSAPVGRCAAAATTDVGETSCDGHRLAAILRSTRQAAPGRPCCGCGGAVHAPAASTLMPATPLRARRCRCTSRRRRRVNAHQDPRRMSRTRTVEPLVWPPHAPRQSPRSQIVRVEVVSMRPANAGCARCRTTFRRDWRRTA